MNRASWAFFLFAATGLAGCALTSKSEPLEPRYYSPEREPGPGAPAAAPVTSTTEIRVGRVSAASHLRDRIVVRESDVQFGYLDEHRWSERPDAYLRRALQRALFEERGVVQVISGEAPVLDLELVAFERVQTAHGRVARVGVHWAVHDSRTVLGQETIVVDKPVSDVKGDDDKADDARAAAYASATRDALTEATARLADRVVAVVAPRRAAP
jgi:uncharacterized lipoprotein YmbA